MVPMNVGKGQQSGTGEKAGRGGTGYGAKEDFQILWAKNTAGYARLFHL